MIECVIISVAFCTACGALMLYIGDTNTKDEKIPIQTNTTPINRTTEIVVDVSGAVKNPFIYAFPSSARFIDAIQKAGGLTDEADRAFVARNINYARVLSDQEKIYIPFLSDTQNGVVGENRRIIEYIQPNLQTSILSAISSESKNVNINTATLLQLDQLPGVGKVQGEAIMNGKPYYTPEDLITKKIIPQSTYDKIKDLISVY